MLNNLEKITVENPVDGIIKQIRQQIINGEVKPGDKLPSERKLATQLGVSRGQIREAINKLEFYGVLKTLPQSGTVVAGLGLSAIQGLFTDILHLEEADFYSLVETRVIMEKQAARLAAIRRTPDDMVNLTNAIKEYESVLLSGGNAVQADLEFHLKIAEASKNSVLKSLMLIITPDIVTSFIDLKVCDEAENKKTMAEHRKILEHIFNQEPDKASKAMEAHLRDVVEFSTKRRSTR